MNESRSSVRQDAATTRRSASFKKLFANRATLAGEQEAGKQIPFIAPMP